MKIETYIITSIPVRTHYETSDNVCHVTFKTDIIVFISNVMMCLTLHRPIMIMINLLILTISLGDIKDKMSKFSNKCKILHAQVKNYLLISDEWCCKVINKFKFKVSYNSLRHEWLWHTVYGPNCSSPPIFLNNLHIILGLRPLNTNLNLNLTDHYVI